MPIYNVWGELTFNVSLLIKADDEDDVKDLLNNLTDFDIIEQSLCGEADRDDLEENIDELTDEEIANIRDLRLDWDLTEDDE